MGRTAENLVSEFGIKRDAQDAFALASHEKALAAQDAGAFDGETIPVRVAGGRRVPEAVVARDEGPRADTSLEKLARLAPVFVEGGTVTAGNASPLSDGAAAVLVASKAFCDAHGLVPMARIVASASAGVPPNLMGTGPIAATNKLLKRTGLSVTDFDLIELNEAFASQALACISELGLPAERVNVHGGAIALGHPIGCSGARIVVTLAHAMKRRGVQRGLATLCIGVGQGLSIALEHV